MVKKTLSKIETRLNKAFKKNRNRINKIFVAMMWVTIFALLGSIWLIGAEFGNKSHEVLVNIYVFFMVISIALFASIIFIGLVKYKREFLLNDYEMTERWASLSPGYKRFRRFMSLFGICFPLLLIVFPIVNIIVNKDFYGIWLMPIGLLVLFNNLKDMRKLRT